MTNKEKAIKNLENLFRNYSDAWAKAFALGYNDAVAKMPMTVLPLPDNVGVLETGGKLILKALYEDGYRYGLEESCESI